MRVIKREFAVRRRAGRGKADECFKMAKDKYYGKTLRKNFARHEEIMPMPNLLEIQKDSYKWFLDTGLREVFATWASSATTPIPWN